MAAVEYVPAQVRAVFMRMLPTTDIPVSVANGEVGKKMIDGYSQYGHVAALKEVASKGHCTDSFVGGASGVCQVIFKKNAILAARSALKDMAAKNNAQPNRKNLVLAKV